MAHRFKAPFGVGTEYKLSGTPVLIELPNTPIGNLVLGGYDLTSQPIGLAIETNISKRRSKSPTRCARTRPTKNGCATSKATPLMSFGVGKPCKGGEKSVACCPPPGPTSACATLPGNFPITGTVVGLPDEQGRGAVRRSGRRSNLKSVNFEATGELELLSNRETGIELSSLRNSTIPEASLAPIFKVKEASFVYYFPGNPDPEKRDSWQAKATITFGLLNEAGPGRRTLLPARPVPLGRR